MQKWSIFAFILPLDGKITQTKIYRHCLFSKPWCIFFFLQFPKRHFERSDDIFFVFCSFVVYLKPHHGNNTRKYIFRLPQLNLCRWIFERAFSLQLFDRRRIGQTANYRDVERPWIQVTLLCRLFSNMLFSHSAYSIYCRLIKARRLSLFRPFDVCIFFKHFPFIQLKLIIPSILPYKYSRKFFSFVILRPLFHFISRSWTCEINFSGSIQIFIEAANSERSKSRISGWINDLLMKPL